MRLKLPASEVLASVERLAMTMLVPMLQAGVRILVLMVHYPTGITMGMSQPYHSRSFVISRPGEPAPTAVCIPVPGTMRRCNLELVTTRTPLFHAVAFGILRRVKFHPLNILGLQDLPFFVVGDMTSYPKATAKISNAVRLLLDLEPRWNMDGALHNATDFVLDAGLESGVARHNAWALVAHETKHQNLLPGFLSMPAAFQSDPKCLDLPSTTPLQLSFTCQKGVSVRVLHFQEPDFQMDLTQDSREVVERLVERAQRVVRHHEKIIPPAQRQSVLIEMVVRAAVFPLAWHPLLREFSADEGVFWIAATRGAGVDHPSAIEALVNMCNNILGEVQNQFQGLYQELEGRLFTPLQAIMNKLATKDDVTVLKEG